MSTELHRLAQEVDLDAQALAPLRLRFGLACARRVRHLLESPEAIEGLDTLKG
jgi:hypothetical protein